jgi:putative heme iron utilization protein
MKNYEDIIVVDAFIDEVANLVHTDDGGVRMTLGSVLIENTKTVFARAEKAEKALGEIREAMPPKPIPGTSMTIEETLREWGKLGTIHQILGTYYKEKA